MTKTIRMLLSEQFENKSIIFLSKTEGYQEWLNKEIYPKDEIIKREIEMLCLSCGKDLHKEIMDRKIRLHFCKDCRIKLIDGGIKNG